MKTELNLKYFRIFLGFFSGFVFCLTFMVVIDLYHIHLKRPLFEFYYYLSVLIIGIMGIFFWLIYKMKNRNLIMNYNSLAESELKYRTAFNTSPNSININSIEGVYIDINEGFTKFTGYSREEVIGINSSEIEIWAHSEDREKIVINLQRQGFVDNLECTFICRDGTRKTALMSAHIIQIKDRAYILSIAKDITDRKKIEQELIDAKEVALKKEQGLIIRNEEFEALNEELRQTNIELHNAKERVEESEFFLRESQESGKIGSFKVDFRNGYWYSSAMLDEIFGIDEKYHRNIKGWLNIVYYKERNALKEYLRSRFIVRMSSFEYEYRIVRIKDKQVRWVQSFGDIKFDDSGNISQIIGTIQDITDKKIMQLELKVAKEKAEESSKLKTAFLNNMSHEIRTPLNAIAGFSQLITRPNLTPEKLNEYSKLIASGTEKLLDVVTDVIEIAQIHAHQMKLNINELDIIDFIHTLHKSFTKKTQLKNLELILDLEIPFKEYIILTDVEKLVKLFSHLLDNAIKYTVKGSIGINCKLVKTLNTIFLEVSISDTGIGISTEMQKIIFEPFYQVETNMNRNYGGNGLGLAIAKSYAELFEGSIDLESETGKGTTVNVIIPLKLPVRVNKKNGIDLKKYSVNTILIVDDEYNNYLYLLELLDEANLQVEYAQNGQQAVDLCKSNSSVDLILMDIKMPVMDGHTAAKLIKSFLPNIPIIAQTAFALQSEKNYFSDVFDDYITKPIQEQEFAQKLVKYIRNDSIISVK